MWLCAGLTILCCYWLLLLVTELCFQYDNMILFKILFEMYQFMETLFGANV